VHPLEQSAEGVVIALSWKCPRLAVSAEELGPLRLTHSGVEAEDTWLNSAGAIVGVIDAPINGASLGAYGRGFADPLAWDLHTVAYDLG